jgi:hypothetical protein
MAITILDPLAQSFIIDSASYPYGVFLSSIRLFFKTKPSVEVPVHLSIVTTQNAYPTSKMLDYSEVVLHSSDVKISNDPQYLDSTTYTEFTFPSPVYIKSDELYAFVLRTNSSEYNLWCAQQNDLPIPSSVKSISTDPTPSTLSKISKSPYIGTLYESQNGINYDADQTKDLMFVINRCSFTIGSQATLNFIVPNGLNKNSLVESGGSKNYSANVVFDQYNLSVSDLKSEKTKIEYSTQLMSNTSFSLEDPKSVTPGIYGVPATKMIYLSDNNGKRVLTKEGTRSSFYLNAVLSSEDETVSPVISDDGTNLFVSKNVINEMPISNNIIVITSGGTGYLSGASGRLSGNISISAPDESDGEQATIEGYCTSGVLTNIYVTYPGSGYTTNPTITISAGSSTPASVLVYGETSPSGGNGLVRYQTIPVVLASGNDSGDLRVYVTAYRPPYTNFYVYYKIVSRSDSLQIEQSSWQKMTFTGRNPRYSTTRDDLIEFELSPGTSSVPQNYVSYTNPNTGIKYNDFYKYAIKIVMSSYDSTFCPFIKDMRVIALPPGVN